MSEQRIFRIRRYQSGRIDPPEFQDFTVTLSPGMSVLDALEQIRSRQDATLMYRHSCHHASCGTCACTVNGLPRLTCITRIDDLPPEVVRLEPLAHFTCLGDLVVDMQPFYRELSADWSYLRPVAQEGCDRAFERFENCIECGACVAACPVEEDFMGPAALAALHRQLVKAPQQMQAMQRLIDAPRGEARCERALACSRVCPSAVYPARHIAQLHRRR